VLGWRKFVLIKYYRKIDDVDIGNPLKHLTWGVLLWMVLHVSKSSIEWTALG